MTDPKEVEGAQASTAAQPNGASEKTPTPLKSAMAPARKPTRQFPTTRIALAKQLDLLRAFDAASGPSLTPTTLAKVSQLIGMTVSTISLANPFFVNIGLLRKIDSTKFASTPEVHEYTIAYEWNRETAAHKLAPTFRNSWFWHALETQIKFKGAMQEHEASAMLAQASDASQDYKPQIMWCIQYLEAVGLIAREGGVIRFGAAYNETNTATTTEVVQVEQEEAGKDTPPAPSTKKVQPSGIATSFTQQPEGMLRFHVSVNVEMTEMRDWRPDRITALFAGIAQVLSAKADVEREGANES